MIDQGDTCYDSCLPLKINKTCDDFHMIRQLISKEISRAEHEYRKVSKVSALLTFEISGLEGRLLLRGRLLSKGAYFRVVIFSIGYF